MAWLSTLGGDLPGAGSGGPLGQGRTDGTRGAGGGTSLLEAPRHFVHRVYGAVPEQASSACPRGRTRIQTGRHRAAQEGGGEPAQRRGSGPLLRLLPDGEV